MNDAFTAISRPRIAQSAACRAAKYGYKTHDQQFAEVMTSIAGPWIGDIIKGGEEGFHVRFRLQRGC